MSSNLHASVSKGPSAPKRQRAAAAKRRRSANGYTRWTQRDLRTLFIARWERISFPEISREFLPHRSLEAVKHKLMQVERDLREIRLGTPSVYNTPESHLDWAGATFSIDYLREFSTRGKFFLQFKYVLDSPKGLLDKGKQQVEQEEDGDEDEDNGQDDEHEVEEDEKVEDREDELPTEPANRSISLTQKRKALILFTTRPSHSAFLSETPNISPLTKSLKFRTNIGRKPAVRNSHFKEHPNKEEDNEEEETNDQEDEGDDFPSKPTKRPRITLRLPKAPGQITSRQNLTLHLPKEPIMLSSTNFPKSGAKSARQPLVFKPHLTKHVEVVEEEEDEEEENDEVEDEEDDGDEDEEDDVDEDDEGEEEDEGDEMDEDDNAEDKPDDLAASPANHATIAPLASALPTSGLTHTSPRSKVSNISPLTKIPKSHPTSTRTPAVLNSGITKTKRTPRTKPSSSTQPRQSSYPPHPVSNLISSPLTTQHQHLMVSAPILKGVRPDYNYSPYFIGVWCFTRGYKGTKNWEGKRGE